MKTRTTLLSLIALTSLLASSGCSGKSKDADPTVSTATPAATVAVPPVVNSEAAPVTPTATDPFVEIAVALDNVTKDQTPTLAAPQTNMDRAINARIEAWKATGATSTNKSEEKLALARTDFAQKLSALSVADDATWKNAKIEAQSSLKDLQVAYRELLAGPTKN